MSNRHDIHYGRQGGRIVPFVQPAIPGTCVVCGGVMHAVTGQDRHMTCDTRDSEPEAESLFGGAS